MIAPRLAPLVAVVLAACGGEPAPLVAALDAATVDATSAADGSDVVAVDLVLPLEASAADVTDAPPARDVVCGPGAAPSGGACVCLDGFRLCAGACLDTRTDPRNCGACGASCGAAACVGGACVCNGPVCRGVCSDITADPMNCGACGHACQPFPNANGVCVEGSCGAACLPGFGDCDINAANGCETDTMTNNTHCGGCGRTCPRGMTCRGGACG